MDSGCLGDPGALEHVSAGISSRRCLILGLPPPPAIAKVDILTQPDSQHFRCSRFPFGETPRKLAGQKEASLFLSGSKQLGPHNFLQAFLPFFGALGCSYLQCLGNQGRISLQAVAEGDAIRGEICSFPDQLDEGFWAARLLSSWTSPSNGTYARGPGRPFSFYGF